MGLKKWLENLVMKKALRSGIGVVIALLCSEAVSAKLREMGITLDKAQLEVALLALISGGIEALRAWLKQKYGLKFL